MKCKYCGADVTVEDEVAHMRKVLEILMGCQQLEEFICQLKPVQEGKDVRSAVCPITPLKWVSLNFTLELSKDSDSDENVQ